MHRLLFLVCAVVLVDCSATQLQQAQSSLSAASADILATVDAACVEYVPVAAALAATANATADAYLKYGNSVCRPASGSGGSPVPVDASTAAWVGAITGALKLLAAAPATAA